MCIASKPKVQAPPAPVILPPPTLPNAPQIAQGVSEPEKRIIGGENQSSQTSEQERKKKVERLRYGLASTIKTRGRGITGSGAELSSGQLVGKNSLGG